MISLNELIKVEVEVEELLSRLIPTKHPVTTQLYVACTRAGIHAMHSVIVKMHST